MPPSFFVIGYDSKVKTKAGQVIAVMAAMLAATGIIIVAAHRTQPKPAPAAEAPAGQPEKPVVQLDPLQIEAIRQRPYPGSNLTIVRNLGNQGGYTSQIASYQSDGLTIYALVATPAAAQPPGGWPVVILNHGYINPAQYVTNGASYREWVGTLARAGFMVVKPDYRGNGQSQGQPEGGHFSPVYTYDVLNLLATLKQVPGVNPNRVGMLGHSMGGHVSLRAIVVAKDVKATVLAAGVVGSMDDIFYSWPNSPAPRDQPTALTHSIRQALVDKYGTPKTNPDFWNSASAINYVHDIAGPVQVDQDVGDSTVLKLFSDHLVDALQAAGKPVEYNLFPGDDHSFVANRTAFFNHIVEFFKQNL